MENKTINIAIVEKIAIALKELNKEFVFVGGSVISVYTDDPSADEIRPTKDIDLTIQLKTYSDWNKLQERLQELGFYPDSNGTSICSFKFQDVSIDIMLGENNFFGEVNKWYTSGFQNIWEIHLKSTTIRILSSPYFLATKFTAFQNRGKNYRSSHDFEDIIYILDNRTTIVEEIKNSDEVVKSFLILQLTKLKGEPNFNEIVSSHIHPLIREERETLLIQKITDIISSQ
jgi:predicted nucleotidyltransferase